MAEPFNFGRDWSGASSDRVRDLLAECGCRPPGHPQPRYVLLEPDELRKGGWSCPH